MHQQHKTTATTQTVNAVHRVATRECELWVAAVGQPRHHTWTTKRLPRFEDPRTNSKGRTGHLHETKTCCPADRAQSPSLLRPQKASIGKRRTVLQPQCWQPSTK